MMLEDLLSRERALSVNQEIRIYELFLSPLPLSRLVPLITTRYNLLAGFKAAREEYEKEHPKGDDMPGWYQEMDRILRPRFKESIARGEMIDAGVKTARAALFADICARFERTMTSMRAGSALGAYAKNLQTQGDDSKGYARRILQLYIEFLKTPYDAETLKVIESAHKDFLWAIREYKRSYAEDAFTGDPDRFQKAIRSQDPRIPHHFGWGCVSFHLDGLLPGDFAVTPTSPYRYTSLDIDKSFPGTILISPVHLVLELPKRFENEVGLLFEGIGKDYKESLVKRDQLVLYQPR